MNLFRKENQTSFLEGSHFRDSQLNCLLKLQFFVNTFCRYCFELQRVFILHLDSQWNNHCIQGTLERFGRYVCSRVIRFDSQLSRAFIVCSAKGKALNSTHCPNIGVSSHAKITGSPVDLFASLICVRVRVGMGVFQIKLRQ